MKRLYKQFLICFFALLLSISVAYANLSYSELTALSLDELVELKSLVSDAQKTYHEPTSTEKSAALSATKSVVEDYFDKQNITISWAWVSYDYSQEWDFFTVSTHIDYKDAKGTKQKNDVYAELFRTNNAYDVYYVTVGKTTVLDKRNDLPQTKWNANSDGLMAESISTDLRPLSADELKKLTNAIDEEINSNHTADSRVTSKIESVTKDYVNKYFEEQAITVEWPWFDYAYTCDWSYYTLTTRIAYRIDDKKVESPVYVESYPIDGEYQLVLVTLAEDVLLDNRSMLPANIPGKDNGVQTTPTPTVAPTLTATQTPTPSPTPTVTPTPQLVDYTVLKRGSKGDDVKALQERLISLGFLAGSADGDFGRKTETALIAYQTSAGLETTGIYDESTAFSIIFYVTPSPSPKPVTTPAPTVDPKSMVLQRGDKGEDVKQLQLRLISLGYLTGSADGDFGKKTEAALIAYQDAAGLPETGKCDYVTFQSVTSSFAPVAPTQAPTPKPTIKPTKSSNNDNNYSGGTTYIGNKNTKKFHYSWCSSVNAMKDTNKVSLSSRDAAISRGYVPCKKCNP